jgi:hypothetical protein
MSIRGDLIATLFRGLKAPILDVKAASLALDLKEEYIWKILPA